MWQANWAGDFATDMVEVEVDQLVVDMWHVLWVNERVPCGLARGCHMAPPCYGLKVYLDSARV
jgi:hypothetical protein